MSTQPSNVRAEIRPPFPRVEGRWKEVAKAGYQPVPDVLIFYQHELGVRSEDLNVLLNLSAHWYQPKRMPYPRPTTIAKRMGVSERSVQRSLTRLKQLGLIGKTKNADGRPSFDLAPLVEKLRPYAERKIKERESTDLGA